MLIEFLAEYGLFLAKALTVVVAIVLVIGAIGQNMSRNRDSSFDRGQISIKDLTLYYQDLKEELARRFVIDDKKALKKLIKAQKKASKTSDSKKTESGTADTEDEPGKLFVIDFDGDVDASEVDALREVVSAILLSADKKQDEVLLRLESPGGVVHGYGLAAAQLKRLTDSGINLTVSVDQVAASGGYLMASVAPKIIASPFAIIGSIGVIAELPNFNKLLKKNHIDYEQHTAGEFKRTLTMFGENSKEARQKFQEQLSDTHSLFKSFVADNRPSLKLDQVATGEYWYGTEAQSLGLIDEIKTSDDFILSATENRAVYEVSYDYKQTIKDRLPSWMADSMIKVVRRIHGFTSRLFI